MRRRATTQGIAEKEALMAWYSIAAQTLLIVSGPFAVWSTVRLMRERWPLIERAVWPNDDQR
jgi:hypothetical protein